MEGQGFFFQAFVYLTAAVISVPIARRLGLGSVLGYLIAGVVIGPFALGLVGSEGQDVLHFAEFGVVMMLFIIGLELQPALLWRLRGVLLGLGGLQVAVTAGAIFAAALALGLEWRPAAAVGLILALSSTAIVLQSLTEKGLLKTVAGERSFAVLLFQDLAVIPVLAVLPLLASVAPEATGANGHAGAWAEQLPGWARGIVTLGAVAGIVLAGQFLVRPVFRFIARSGVREVFTAAALLLVVGIALAMQQVGLSPALGTFLGGVVLANSEYRHELESDVEPFKGLLLGLFFIAVGASIDFGLVTSQIGVVTALVLGLIALKFVVLFALGRSTGMEPDQNLLFALALAQGGEFCFVLLSFATQIGVLPGSTSNLLVATVALSMAFTPFLLLLHEKVLAPRLARVDGPVREPDAIHEENPVILAGFGAFGSIIGRMLVANGVHTTFLDLDSDHVDLMRRLGLEVFYGDASREDLLRAAGAEKARLIVVTTGSLEKTLEIIATVKKHFPRLQILARAHIRAEAYELLDAGADEIYRESLDTALRMGVDVMRSLGFRAHESVRAAQFFRRHDEKSWRELASVRHDQTVFMTRARQAIHDLEQRLRSETGAQRRVDDSAWDATSLRKEFGRPKDD